jgi:hypothetical protein
MTPPPALDLLQIPAQLIELHLCLGRLGHQLLDSLATDALDRCLQCLHCLLGHQTGHAR